jgi:predicted ATPase
MDDRLTFGAVLKRYRLAAGLTHEALAERASIGARTISDLERGVSRAPRADTLALLENALDLSPQHRERLRAAARPQAAGGMDDRALSENRLSLPLTSFVGREQEAAAIGALLRRDDIRLATLSGPGGVGKTRLAHHVAIQSGSVFPDGVVEVDLAPVTGPDDVTAAIGRAVGAGDQIGSSLQRLAEMLGERKVLLMLDNFEHLLPAGSLVMDLLHACPHLTVLTTSRAVLRLSAEHEVAVLPLPVPDLATVHAAEDMAHYAAVALFVARARQINSDFSLSGDNAAAVGAICALLDGLPLAIELAAARVRTLPPRVLLDRLRRTPTALELGLLSDGPRDTPARLRTLRDTIAWSHALLTLEEQRLFRRLAVFAGGCTLEAAESVCGSLREASDDASEMAAELPPAILVLDALHSLVAKSLLAHDIGPDGAARFRMLETIRAYAWERLAASGEDIALRRRHAQYFLSIVEGSGALLFATRGKRDALAAEQGNIQAALHWLVQQG